MGCIGASSNEDQQHPLGGLPTPTKMPAEQTWGNTLLKNEGKHETHASIDGRRDRGPSEQMMNLRIMGRIALACAALALVGTWLLCCGPKPHSMGYGMHTLRGTGEELSLVRAAGFDWVVQVFSWREIARWRGLYNWEQPDSVVRGAEYFKLNLVARLDQHPAWARNESADNGPPDDLGDYGDFVHAVASRYNGQIEGYVIWNEPNLAVEWGGDEPDPEAYVEMLKVAYARIKEADPSALVVSAGLAPTNEQSTRALDDRLFLEQMYQAGAREYFDVLGAHVYGFGHPPDDPHDAHQGLNISRIHDLRKIMVAHGDVDKPVWITELGWTTSPPEEQAGQGVTSEEQADYLVEVYRRAREDWPWLELLTVWNVGAGIPSDESIVGYGIIKPDSGPSPAYFALKEMPKRGIPDRIVAGLEECGLAVTRACSDERVRALADDVIIHLGDNHWPTPWVPLYHGQLPSPIWTGEFYVREPGDGIWTLSIELMQNNERTNYLLVNGHPVEPPYFPPEDYSRSWVSLNYRVPADCLQRGLNELTIVVGKEIPSRQRPGTYEDLQFRDIVLRRR
jgi:beta-xylosidase